MDDIFLNDDRNGPESNIIEEFYRYLAFWPYFLVFMIVCLFLGGIFLRYTEFQYKTTSVIEILDPAQDSEMALPTSLTVFNRSMINLQNEIGIFSSNSLHTKTVKKLKSNIKFFDIGDIKTSENHKSEWFEDYDLNFKIDTDEVKSILEFELKLNDNELVIRDIQNNKTYIFDDLSTENKQNNLPFSLVIRDNRFSNTNKSLSIFPVDYVSNEFRKSLNVSVSSDGSDQLDVSIIHPNSKIAREYLDNLVFEFDRDGVYDRQLEYKNTIDFVDRRSKILKSELELIEIEKQNFKQKNNLSDLQSDAESNIKDISEYETQLFSAESQKSLASFLKSSIENSQYKYLPINIGFDNFDINSVILEYNQLVREREKYISAAGPNNSMMVSIETQLDNYIENISNSIENYLSSIEIKIVDLKEKEKEFKKEYSNVPVNEKILRSIERELSVKEALFLLLLQKREEAAINYAVVKPTIKVIDLAITSKNPISPNVSFVWLISLVFGLGLPFLFLFIKFTTDNKFHTKEQLMKFLRKDIPVIAEIPYVGKDHSEVLSNSLKSRGPLSESIRMLISNLGFTFLDEKYGSKVILFTSSIKGEGKTLVSINTANILSSQNKKVLLIGADLRNPQIHKFLGVEKDLKGISDLIHKNDFENFEKYLLNYNKLDILLSGTIPPNPTELLGSEHLKSFIDNLRSSYDYIIVDSAPCLLVSDTFQISNSVDSIVYLIRSNHTEYRICNFINEIKDKNRFKNLNIVLNAVGNSASYGYKYGYQYGYKYGYKYGYNYGYGYGYSSDDE